MAWVGNERPFGRYVIWSQARREGGWTAGCGDLGKRGPITGPTEEEAVSLVERALARSDPDHRGFDEALRLFLSEHPGAFGDPAFAADRDAFAAASSTLRALVPDARAQAADGRAARLLAMTDAVWGWPVSGRRAIPALVRALRGPDGAGVVRATAHLAEDDGSGWKLVDAALRGEGAPRTEWLHATLMPALRDPQAEVLVVPSVMDRYARIAGDPYWIVQGGSPGPEAYRAARQLAARTRAAIADLAPRDNADALLFMQTVAAFR